MPVYYIVWLFKLLVQVEVGNMIKAFGIVGEQNGEERQQSGTSNKA